MFASGAQALRGHPGVDERLSLAVRRHVPEVSLELVAGAPVHMRREGLLHAHPDRWFERRAARLVWDNVTPPALDLELGSISTASSPRARPTRPSRHPRSSPRAKPSSSSPRRWSAPAACLTPEWRPPRRASRGPSTAHRSGRRRGPDSLRRFEPTRLRDGIADLSSAHVVRAAADRARSSFHEHDWAVRSRL